MFATGLEKVEYEFYAIHIDSKGWVWLGGRHYVWHNGQKTLQPSLWILKPGADKFEPFLNAEVAENPLEFSDIRDIFEDQLGNIWLGTKGGGLLRVDHTNREIRQYVKSVEHPSWIDSDNIIWQLIEDQNAHIWLATESEGAIRFVPEDEAFFPYPHDPTGKKGLIDPQLTSIEKDGDGNLWIGSKSNGIQIINPRKPDEGPLKWLNPAGGLPNKRIVGIQKDAKNDMWISTESGLARYQYDTQKFISFSTVDGLENTNLMSLGLDYAENDQMYIGQQHAYYHLNPAELYRPKKLPPVVLTDFKVLEDSRKFDRHINFMEEIILKYADNFFSIEFALLDFQPAKQKQYAYKLDGYDADWVYPSNSRNTASYTNVREGTYTFTIRAIDAYNPSVKTEHSLIIQVKPPWYRSWWAYSFYVLVIALLLGSFYRFQLHRQLALQETERLKELDAVKTKLYTNITHEFRTPLTVIMGMNKQIKGNEEEKKIIHRNSQQLLNLVNQMLDLRKLESGNMPLNWVKGDIIQYLRYIQESFHSFAEVRDIRLHFLANPESFEMDYDEEKLRNIISNLLTNAIKYSTAGGDVYLMLEGGKLPEANSRDLKSPIGEVLKIAVRDKGIGIADDKLPHIFDRFYQVDDRLVRAEEGTGIGLALTRELVKLLAGTISVKSTLGKGSEFTVLLPVSRAATQAASSGEFAVDLNLSSMAKGSTGSLSSSPVKSSNNQPIILVVEDNLDVAHYIRTTLEAHYDMRFAQNGQEGIDQARELIPDLIISDVMMPIKDGFEVCDTLKNDPKTSHIPLILLTAKADVSSKLAGLKRGADAYLAKPFNETELLIRMEKLLESRDKLRKYYFSLATNKELTFEETAEEELENNFVQQVREIIEAHLTETQFSVQDLSKEMGMSHSQLHRKITALTGKSISNLIRSIRLNKAKELLQDHRLTIASIAYDCGFNDPDYFHRVFKKNFNMTPGEFRNLGES